MPTLPPRLHQSAKPKTRTGSVELRPKGAAWNKTRERILQRDPLCRYCFRRGHIAASTVVDHVTALALGGGSTDDNLAGSCRPCNSEKAKLEQAWLNAGWPVDSLKLAAPLEGSLKWFLDAAE